MICGKQKRNGTYVGHVNSSHHHRDANNLNMSVYIEERRLRGAEESAQQNMSFLPFGISVIIRLRISIAQAFEFLNISF